MILINQKDCNTTRQNLGLPDCILEHGIPKGFIPTDVDWGIDVDSDTFDSAYANSQIQLGNFVPFLGASEFIDNTPEPTTEEFQGGNIEVVRNGKPYFQFKYTNGGWALARASYTYNSTGAFNMLLVFEDGSIGGVLNGTTFTGFKLGMLNTGTYMHTNGTNKGNFTVTMQLTDVNEYNLYSATIDRSVLGFNANDLKPITDIVMTGRADISDNKVYFKPKFRINQASILGGIAIANLRATVDGVADIITPASLTYDSLTQEWSFVPTTAVATAQSWVVQLYDGVNAIDVAKIGNRYYKGATPSFVSGN